MIVEIEYGVVLHQVISGKPLIIRSCPDTFFYFSQETFITVGKYFSGGNNIIKGKPYAILTFAITYRMTLRYPNQIPIIIILKAAVFLNLIIRAKPGIIRAPTFIYYIFGTQPLVLVSKVVYCSMLSSFA